ncbi:MAG: ankyrin repeat domain-containing protein [Legionellales bacterium]|jgi:hypothetical protein
MRKKYKVLAGRGEFITLQEGLYNQLVDAIIDGDSNKFSEALTKFRPFWSADEDCHAASKIKEQFGENFNKLKIRLYDGKSFVELTPLQLAAKSGHVEILDFLLRNTSEPQVLLAETIQVKTLEQKQEVGLNNKEINGFNYVSGSTALHLALEQEHFTAARLFLENNNLAIINPLTINPPNDQLYPPIFLAAATSNLDMVDYLLAKGANRVIRVNGMNFADYAQRYGASVELTGGAYQELNKRLSNDFVPLTLEPFMEKFTNVKNVVGLDKALSYIAQAKKNITAKALAEAKIEEQQKFYNLQNQLAMLESSIKSLAILIAQARSVLADRKTKNLSDPLIEKNENHLLIMEDRTNAIIRKFCDSAQQEKLYDIDGLIYAYKMQMYANLSALSENPALKKWLWRGFWAVLTIGLVLSGAGIITVVAGVSFEAALLAVVSFGALKSVELAVIPAVIPVALIAGAVGNRCTEHWNNKTGKRAVKEVIHNLQQFHAIKTASVFG